MNTLLGMGAKPRTKKKTDYHPRNFASATPIPITFQTSTPIIYMQNQQPCCGADLTTQYLNVLFGITGSPEFTWKNIRKIDGYPPNAGSESSTLGKVAQTIGTCDLSLMPDNSNVSDDIYASYTGVTQPLLDNASSRKIANYAFIDNPTFQQIKDSIFQHKAVGLRVNCGDGWYTPSWLEKDMLPLKLGNYVDDHFILATGFDANYIYFTNSWSTAWGRQGIGYFDSSYIPYVKELIVFIPPGIATYKFNNVMYFGQTSADIHALQGVLSIPQTGFYWFSTTAAVKAYQVAHNLSTLSQGFVVMSDMLQSLNAS